VSRGLSAIAKFLVSTAVGSDHGFAAAQQIVVFSAALCVLSSCLRRRRLLFVKTLQQKSKD